MVQKEVKFLSIGPYLLNTYMIEDLQSIYDEILEEGRTSKHQFSDMSLKEAHEQCRNIFKNLGFTTAATFAIPDFIYRLLPSAIKTPEIKAIKGKSSGAYLRPFVVNLINQNIDKIDLDDLKEKMTDPELVKQYLNREDYGNRRQGKLAKLSSEEGREIRRDY